MKKKTGLFQIIYTNYLTSTNKQRIKKEFIFLEEFYYNNTTEYLENYKNLSNRYKNLSNVTIIDYDNTNNAYLFYKNRNTTLKLEPIKGELQQGIKIDYIRSW